MMNVLEEENRRFREALERIKNIPDKMFGGDWDEIEEARGIATEALNPTAPAVTSGRPDLLEDGFGSTWQKCQPYEKCRMQIVRPGKMQCDCMPAESDQA